MRRHEIADEHWGRIKDFLPGQAGDPGVTAKDNRLFINAVLWIAKTGAPWRDLPERFGPWQTIYNRHRRWSDTFRRWPRGHRRGHHGRPYRTRVLRERRLRHPADAAADTGWLLFSRAGEERVRDPCGQIRSERHSS